MRSSVQTSLSTPRSFINIWYVAQTCSVIVCAGNNRRCARDRLSLCVMMKPRFTLTPSMHVECDAGVSGHFDVKEVKVCVDGADETLKFFHVRKTNFVLSKILCSSADADKIVNKKRPLTQTNIIEEITRARDVRFSALLASGRSGDKPNRYTEKHVRAKVLGLPETMDVDVPSVHGVASRTMVMLATKPSSEVWIEMNSDNLEYMCDVVAAQIEHDTIVRKHPRAERGDDDGQVDIAGVTFSNAKKAYRLKYTVEGSTREQYFSVAKAGDTEARDLASQASGRVRCSHVHAGA